MRLGSFDLVCFKVKGMNYSDLSVLLFIYFACVPKDIASDPTPTIAISEFCGHFKM